MVISRASLLLSLSLVLSGNASFAMYDSASQVPVNTQPVRTLDTIKEYGVPGLRSATCTAAGTGLGLYLASQVGTKKGAQSQQALRFFPCLAAGAAAAFYLGKDDGYLWTNISGSFAGLLVAMGADYRMNDDTVLTK